MFLEKLTLTNFKNYESEHLLFNRRINCLMGANGEGKTNLLDAIYYLSFTKSAFNSIDSQNISYNESAAAIHGSFQKNEETISVACGLQVKQKKTFKINKKELGKLSQHIGQIPLVLISPDDTFLIREGSESRRKFVDSAIAQIDDEYLDVLIRYNHVLKQRNSLLKDWPPNKKPDKNLFDSYDQILIPIAGIIWKKRKQFIVEFHPFFETTYRYLSESRERVRLIYKSELEDGNFARDFKKAFDRDLMLKRTTMGIHKDDCILEMDERPIKKFGSQGQQKSMIIAMKLAQHDLLANKIGKKPLLLLDDIFDKLDDYRIKQLVSLVNQDKFGQIFITDARPERSYNFFKKYGDKVSFYEIKNGKAAQVYGEEKK